MGKIQETAKKQGYEYVLDGKNTDDLKVYRPGNKASEELGIISPLADLGFSKEDIRENAKKLGIKFWNKPSNSCLATRFPYNTNLSREDLEKVDKSEEIIKELGINKVRVRVHNNIARIEVEKQNFGKILKNETIVEQIKKLGFNFVTLDLNGLKSGSFD